MPVQTYTKFVEALGKARLEGTPLPNLSAADRPLGAEEGYLAQASLAEWFRDNCQGEIAGYKVGATTGTMQNLSVVRINGIAGAVM
jgi:2-keto-4-pentenoate hydratase